jgi:hypothetical protein
MYGKRMTDQEYVQLQKKYIAYAESHPDATSSELFIALNRLMEKHHYGVTSRDLARGYEIQYVKQGKKVIKLRNEVKGAFAVGGPDNRGLSDEPIALYRRTKWNVEKSMTTTDWARDKEIQRSINLAAEEHTTGSDILTAGAPLLDHAGIDTGFGGASGVIDPRFMNMMLRVVSTEAMFKNFARVFPMPDMMFYFPLKVSSPLSDTGAFARPEASIGVGGRPTAEGRAGEDYAISFKSFYVNGWKYLRHAALTRELIEMLRTFIPIQEEYVNDLGIGMRLLWDMTIAEGMFQMLWTAKWWRWDVSGGTWGAGEYVPLSGASGDYILGANAKNHFVYQELRSGNANFGKIYNPDATVPQDFSAADLRDYSATTDHIYELILVLASLAKEKKSKLEYVTIPSKITELMFRDSRFLESIQETGKPKFQSENGYLGQISIGGSESRTDLWEYDSALMGTKVTADGTPRTVLPILGGKYGQAWNQGIWTPFYMRVDDGFEVVQRGTGNVNVLRPNETRVITVGASGASFPGNPNDVVMGLAVVA